MTARLPAALAAFVLLGAGMASPASAGQAWISSAGLSAAIPLTSLREARFSQVVRQQYDFSCGSAAIATLLTYHYGRPTNEQEAFQAMWETGNQEAIQASGFSLADMQRFLASRGISSDGFRMDLDKLAEIGIPAITLINTKGYSHFVVIKGIRDGTVLVGDPALGLKSYARDEFESIWRNVVFVIRDDIDSARDRFNLGEEWAIQRKAPFGTALNRHGLATFSIALPGLNEF